MLECAISLGSILSNIVFTITYIQKKISARVGSANLYSRCGLKSVFNKGTFNKFLYLILLFEKYV